MTKNEIKARKAFAPIKNKQLQARLIARASKFINAQLDDVVFLFENGGK
jgi:hypothetical protein